MKERKFCVMVLGHSDSILKHDNIFSNVSWYHYHGINVSGLNPTSGSNFEDMMLWR